MLGQLPSGEGALQLSWPKDVGYGCSLLLVLSLNVSSGLMVPLNLRTGSLSSVCLLEPPNSHPVMKISCQAHAWSSPGTRREKSQVQGCLLLSVAWASEATVAVKGSVLHLRDYFSSYFPLILCCP